MEIINIDTFLNNHQSFQTLEKILNDKLKILQTEKDQINQKLLEIDSEFKKYNEPLQKREKKEYIQNIILEITLNREESFELNQSIKELTELIEQSDEEIAEWRKKFLINQGDTSPKIYIADKIETSTRVRKENADIKEKMINAAKVNNEQYTTLKSHLDKVIEEYLSHIFKLEQANLAYRQENIDLKISTITFMKDNIAKSKIINERQINIQRLTEEVDILKSQNLAMKDIIAKTQYNEIGCNDKTDRSSTYLEEFNNQLNTPKSIAKPDQKSIISHQAESASNSCYAYPTNIVKTLTTQKNENIPPINLNMNKSPKITDTKSAAQVNNLNSYRYNNENVPTSNHSNSFHLKERNENSIGSTKKKSGSRYELQVPSQNNSIFDKKKSVCGTSRYMKNTADMLESGVSKNESQGEYYKNKAMKVSPRVSRASDDVVEFKEIIPSQKCKTMRNNMDSPDYLQIATSLSTSSLKKEKIINEQNHGLISDKLIESVNKICLEDKDCYGEFNAMYSPIQPFLKSKSFETFVKDSICELSDKLNPNSSMLKVSVDSGHNLSPGSKNPLETEPDESHESQPNSPVISQKARSFYSTVSANYKHNNSISSNSEDN